MTSRRALALTPVLLLALARAAGAQSIDPAAATELFKQGREAMKAGDYAGACPKFAESLRLDAKVGTALNLSECEEHQGRLANARAHLVRAIDLGLAENDDRVPFAQQRLAVLDPRVPRLRVMLAASAPGGTVVKRDDVLLGPGSLLVALPVDPGAHAVVAVADGYEPRTFAVDLTEGQSAELEVGPGPRVPEPPPPQAPYLAVPPAIALGEAPAPTSAPAMRTWAWVTGGVGVAGLAAGSVFGLLAIAKNNDSNATCNASNVCDQPGKASRDSARTFGDVSTVAFAGGAAALATAVVLFVAAPSSKASAVRVVPQIGGATLTGEF